MTRKRKRREIRTLLLLLAGFSPAVAGHVLPARAFTVSGVSFSDFHKSADSCYRCDRDDYSEPAGPDPREVAFQDLVKQANYAWSNNDRSTALHHAQQALMIRDDATLRDWVRRVQALQLADRAAVLADSDDHHGALGLYHQALAMWPDVLADKEEFKRYEAAVARRDQIEAEQRAERQRHAAMLQRWHDADAAALEDMKQGKWTQAVARYEQARMDSLGIADNAGGDPSEVPNTIYANRAVAQAGLARSQGKLDDAIRNLQSALTWNPANETANTLLKLAYEERERSGTAMQATLQKLQPIIADGAVYAGGPKDLAALNASIPEIARSPEAERARKGLVAAAKHDWKVSLAWYQDALNRDPGNPALKRAVDLAQWMVNARPVSGPILMAPEQTSAAPIHDGIDDEAKIMAMVYRELADGFAKTQFTDPRDKAKAAYFANEYRKQAVEADTFAEATNRARERQSLPFK